MVATVMLWIICFCPQCDQKWRERKKRVRDVIKFLTFLKAFISIAVCLSVTLFEICRWHRVNNELAKLYKFEPLSSLSLSLTHFITNPTHLPFYHLPSNHMLKSSIWLEIACNINDFWFFLIEKRKMDKLKQVLRQHLQPSFPMIIIQAWQYGEQVF